jgi:hypothetical protein
MTEDDVLDMPAPKVTSSMLDDPVACERCGGDVPTLAKHGLTVTENGEHVCADCSRDDPDLMGGYCIADGQGNVIYG